MPNIPTGESASIPCVGPLKSASVTENEKIGPETRTDDIKNDEFDRKNTGESAG